VQGSWSGNFKPVGVQASVPARHSANTHTLMNHHPSFELLSAVFARGALCDPGRERPRGMWWCGDSGALAKLADALHHILAGTPRRGSSPAVAVKRVAIAQRNCKRTTPSITTDVTQ
jgi:hypothetical protein